MIYLLLFFIESGMAANVSTLHPNLGGGGGVIGDLFRLLHAVLHGTEAPVYIKYPREAAASTLASIIFGVIASRIPWFLRSTAVRM